MLGAAGAMLCMAAGTALGMAVKERRYARMRLIQDELELLARLRLMLIEERLGLCELLVECADASPEGSVIAQRFQRVAATLKTDPLCGLPEAYAAACRKCPVGYEHAEEKAALTALCMQLGLGTASMREQAVASCMRRLRPLMESARAKADTGGKLCMQLGMLLGLMVGIALW